MSDEAKIALPELDRNAEIVPQEAALGPDAGEPSRSAAANMVNSYLSVSSPAKAESFTIPTLSASCKGAPARYP